MGEASRVPDQVQFHDGHTDMCNAVTCVCRGFAVKTAGAVTSPVTRLSKGS